MSRPPKIPQARLPRTGKPYGRSVAGSAVLHILVIAWLVWEGAPELVATRSAGGPGPRGGGGGGGARLVSYVQLQSYQATRADQTAVTAKPIEIPTPRLPVVKLDDPKLNVPTETFDAASLIAGVGRGTGGGPGSGTGTGGGVGSGEGTGVGTARGPGTGGDGGDIFPPQPRSTFIPLGAKPASVKGRVFRVHFWVDPTGQVTRVEVDPPIRDAAYRREFLEQMYQWTFNPAITRDGVPISADLIVTVTL